MPHVATESQLDTSSDSADLDAPVVSRAVALDLFSSDENGDVCSSEAGDCSCSSCSRAGSVLSAAACAMVDASTRARPKTRREKILAQCMHWGVLGLALMVSLPVLVPIMGEGLRGWTRTNLLAPGAGELALAFAAGLFAVGFVSKLGAERVRGGCAMLRRLGPAAVLGVAWSTLPSFAGVLLVLNMEPIRVALVGDGTLVLGLTVYVAAFVVLAGLGCLPTVSQAILAGYAFGLPLGFGAALIGFGGASLVGYELVKKLAAHRVEHELNSAPKARAIRDALLGASALRATMLIALFRASPSAPFALTNLLLGSLGVNRWAFFFGTLLGMAPRTLAAVLIGLSFTGWNGGFEQPWWVVAIGIAAIVVLLVVMTKISARALGRVTSHERSTPRVAAAGA